MGDNHIGAGSVVRRDRTAVKKRRSRPSSEERFRAAAETMFDGLAVFSSIRDRSGRITDFRYEYVNEALCARVGRSAAQLVGKQLLELFPAHVESVLFADYCEVVASGSPLAKQDVVSREDRGARRVCWRVLVNIRSGVGAERQWEV